MSIRMNRRGDLRPAALALLCALTLVVGLLPLAPPAAAAGFFVTSQGDDVDANPGDGKCNAPGIFQGCTLRAAIMEVNALDASLAARGIAVRHTITLEPGTYRLTRDDFGADDDGSDIGDLDIRARQVTINVEGGGSAVVDARPNDEGSLRRAFEIRAGSDVEMDRLTIRNGAVLDEQGPGGGILNHGTLRLTNTTVGDNSALTGGGIHNAGTLTLVNSRVQNSRALRGGGILNDGTLTLTTSRIQDNSVRNPAGSVAPGGGIVNNAGRTATISRSTISGNLAENGGGGIHNLGALNLDQTTVDSNRVSSGGNVGSGIFNAGSATVRRTTVSRNAASSSITSADGAIINVNAAELTLTNSTISGNSFGSSANFQSSGLLNVGGATARLNMVTITKNSRPGIANSGTGSVVSLANTIVADNAGPSTHPDCSGTLTSLGFNFVGVNSGCIDAPQAGDTLGSIAQPLLALLGPLQNNGGLTETHALTSGLQIDTGNPAPPDSDPLAACASVDQRGLARPKDGNGDGVARCDIGAFERDPTGTFALEPTFATTGAGEALTYGFSWTVPAPEHWRDLAALELRVRDGDQEVLRLRWDEAANTVSLYNEAAGTYGPAFAPGRPNRLENRWATVHLAESAVQGSGPDGPSVTLTLRLSFKHQAAGHTYDVEAAATDDGGQRADFAPAGVLTVLDR